MYNSDKVKECIKGLIGWRDHYDPTEIPALPTALTETEIGEYYQGVHPALRLDLIKATLPRNRDLGEFLTETEEEAVVEILNDLMEKRQLDRTAKSVLANDIIYNSEGWINDVILNESRFVGVRFRIMVDIGLKAVLKRIALQLTQAQTNLTLYLFHSHKPEALAKIDFTSPSGGGFHWINEEVELHAYNENLSGGSFFLGYYQDDVQGQAIQYKKLNWASGYCGTCDGGVNQARYTGISRFVNMQPFYVPNGSLSANKDLMFDPEAVLEVSDTNWGFNFNVSIDCDLTTFWCDNRKTLKNALGLRVAIKVLKMMQFSQQINHVEEQLKMYIIRDLEGDKETNYINIYQRYSKAIKAINFNQSSISKVCLPCDRNSGVTYGMH